MSDLALTLDAVGALLRRYVVLTTDQATAISLWTFHTWALDAAAVTPYLHVTSPEKRSGKTRLLEVLALLVRAPLPSANISDAALFRAIEAKQAPALLFDEIDSIFGPRARDREDLRGLLNAGYRRGTPALRMGGAKMTELQEFPTFCPKAIAGIGKLPDTITDRSIVIGLKRRTRSEHVDRFYQREATAESEPLRQSFEALAAYHVPTLTEARPSRPDALGDRAQDSWEPLLAIAELAGEEWAERGRTAAIVLSGGQDVTDETIGVRLLADIQAAFAVNGDRLSTADLLAALKADDEAPWSDWHGSGLSARRLAELLREYGISSRTIRLEDDSTPKGYRLEQFTDAFARYLTSKRHNATTRMDPKIESIPKTPQQTDVANGKTASNSHEQSDVAMWRQERVENERAVVAAVSELVEDGVLVPHDIGTATWAELREHFGA
jgi:Protein of unknown function (DUF3631)